MGHTVWNEIFTEVIDVLGDYIVSKGGIKSLTEERQKDVEEIHKIFFEDNPVKVLSLLLDYVNNTMTGMWSVLRKDLRNVLTQEKYKESDIVYRMLQDMRTENVKSNKTIWHEAAKKLELQLDETKRDFEDLKADYATVKQELRLVCKDNEEKDKKIEDYENALKLAGDMPTLLAKMSGLESEIKRQQDYLKALEQKYELKVQEAERLAKENKELSEANSKFQAVISLQKEEIRALQEELQQLREQAGARMGVSI